MLNIVVLVSGGGTNLQAIMDKIESGAVTNTKIAAVISNNANAYALERAKNAGIPAECISPKQFETRELFNEEELANLDIYDIYLQFRNGDFMINKFNSMYPIYLKSVV